jgi:hypothetical protein
MGGRGRGGGDRGERKGCRWKTDVRGWKVQGGRWREGHFLSTEVHILCFADPCTLSLSPSLPRSLALFCV